MYKYFLFLLLVCVIGLHNTSAQNIQTASIEWNCSSIFEAQQGVLRNEQAKIVSSPQQIIWYNKDGIVQQTFLIGGSSDPWYNVTQNGSFICNVTYGENTGVVQFSKSNGTTRIRIHLTSEESSPIYEFVVGSLNQL